MLFVTLLVVALAGCTVHGAEKIVDAEKSCTLNLQEETDPKKEALILGVSTTKGETNYNFVWPTPVSDEGVLTVKHGNKLLLACPLADNGNYQVTSGNEEAYAVCNDGSLTINGTAVSESTSSCEKTYAYSWLNVTNESCGVGDNVGIIVQLGFKLDDLADSYFPLARSCFIIERAVTLWTAHQLIGGSLAGAVKSSESRSFAKGPAELFPVVDPAVYFAQKEQVITFDTLLGAGSGEKYITSKNFFNRGHLAPHADFIFNTHRLMTYYYVNAQPQWASFNGGNWEQIESYTRQLAQDVGITVNVWTGTYGILELPNTSGVNTKIFLDPVDMLLPAPEVYWKLIQNPKTLACTVAIGHNNPYLTEAPKPLCPPLTLNGWPDLTQDLAHGYSYYCNYKSFKKVVKFVPKIKCRKLFQFPKST